MNNIIACMYTEVILPERLNKVFRDHGANDATFQTTATKGGAKLVKIDQCNEEVRYIVANLLKFRSPQ